MDSIGDILYILFIIAIGIFQLYRKQMKKNAEREARPVESEEGGKSNPLEDIFGEIFTGTESEERTSTPAGPESGEVYDMPKAEPSPEAVIQEKRNLAIKEMTKRRTMDREDIATLEVETEGSERLNFDLRKAVIYAAIMNPKYKEL